MKLAKQHYITASGEKKLNCYKVNIPKAAAEEAGFDEETEISLEVKPGKIVVKKAGEVSLGWWKNE